MVRVYDPKQIVVSIAGLLLASGFSENNMVKVTREEAVFEKKTGVDGEVTRVRLHNNSGMATVTLMQSSEGNDTLSGLLERDKAAPNGAGIGAFLLKDLNGNTLVRASKAWVKGYPETSFDKSVSERAWEIELADIEIFVGGNVVG